MTQELTPMSEEEIKFFKKFHNKIKENIRRSDSLCTGIDCTECIICGEDGVCYKSSRVLEPMLEQFLEEHQEMLL